MKNINLILIILIILIFPLNLILGMESSNYERKEDTDKSIDTLELVAKSGLGNVDIFFHLGRMYSNSERLDEAENVFDEILKLNPDEMNVLYSLGIIYEKKGELEKALENFEKVSELNIKNGSNSLVTEKINQLKKEIKNKSFIEEVIEIENDISQEDASLDSEETQENMKIKEDNVPME